MKNRGIYIVLEGIDGSGKSTLANRLNEYLVERHPKNNIITTYHPGSTALGNHLRKLVKNPAQFDRDIKIDNLSRQLLHFVDTIAFNKTILEPELNSGSIVIADRSTYISSIIYGKATGLTVNDISKLFMVYPPRKADLVFVFDCPWRIAKERMIGRDQEDFYDNQKDEFFDSISTAYKTLTTSSLEQSVLINQIVSLNNLKTIDAGRDTEMIFNEMIPSIERVIANMGVEND